MDKEKLLKLIGKKNERKQAIATESATCEDVATLRSLSAELDNLNAEIRDLEDILATMPDDNPAGFDKDGQAFRTQAVNGQIPGVVTSGVQQQRAAEPTNAETRADKFASVEYRNAFMQYVTKGTAIPSEYRSDAFTSVTDAAAVIPTTIMNEIIKEMKQYGQLFSRVRKINIQGGVQIPILSLKPTATRITESTPSERKKMTVNTYISFSYFGLECKVAVSLLANTVTLAMFEEQIVPLITEAMVKRQEYEVFKGTGSGEMLGVINDNRVASGQKIALSPSEITDWTAWKKKIFAKMPLSYRDGIFVMGAGTFDGYIDGMTDANGQPIARVTYGITEGTNYRFGGKEVLEVEGDILPSYDDAATGDVIAVFMKPTDYAINSNMQMAMYRWLDHDTNQWVDKAILINDGKLIDAAGVILIKKGE